MSLFNCLRLTARSTFNCKICMEDLPSSSRFRPRGHVQSSICRPCMVKYISSSISQGKLARFPISECNWMLNPSACRDLVTREVFDQWSELLRKSAILGCERCYCPNRDCQELIISECGPPESMKIRCPSCKKSCCSRCSNPWHNGECDTELIKEIKEQTRCPGCKNYVERAGGCRMINCRCGTQFCYRCGRKKNDCDYTFYLGCPTISEVSNPTPP